MIPTLRISGDDKRAGSRSWILIATGNLFGLGLSVSLTHDCMNSTVDYVVSAETETEVERTSAISSEVQSHSHNLQKELVWPEMSFGSDHWDLVARLDPDAA